MLIAIVTNSYQHAFVERSKLFGKVRVPLLARQQYKEEGLKSESTSRRWSFRFMYFVVISAFEVSFIHFTRLMISQRMNTMENDEPYSLLSILTSIFFMITANIAMMSDLCDMFRLTYVNNSRIANCFGRMKQWFWYRVIGIRSCGLGNHVDKNKECDGWVNYVLTQTKDAIEISEHNILNDIRTLVSRLEQKGLLS